jgi:hypothetical protein
METNTFKENSKKINDKIQELRDENLGTITILKLFKSSDIWLIMTELELANLQAWNAQIINDCFESPPEVEYAITPKCFDDFTILRSQPNEFLFKLMCRIREHIKAIGEIIDLLIQEQSQSNYFTIENFVLKRDEQIEATSYSLTRMLDCFNDAALWCKLNIHRNQ